MAIDAINKFSLKPNTHDLFKFIAVIIMTVDHLGAYLHINEPFLRSFGRICVPIWFFFAGYTKTLKISNELIVYAGLLTVGMYLVDGRIFPLNALYSIIFCRLVLRYIDAKKKQLNAFYIVELFFLLTFSHIVLMFLFEYGSLAVGFAILGYFVRNDALKPYIYLLAIIVNFCFLFTQIILFKFNFFNAVFTIFFTSLVVFALCNFKQQQVLENRKFPFLKTTIMVFSRYSLEYYFIHKILFLWLGVFLFTK